MTGGRRGADDDVHQAAEVDIAAGVDVLRSRLPSIPDVTVVAGSGLGAVTSALEDPVTVPFAELPGLPSAGVSGHQGAFVHGRLGDAEILIQSGRLHVYEGHPLDVVVAPVRILAALGVTTLILTNAAGGIHPHMRPGDVVLVSDLLNLQFRSPLAGQVRPGEARFPDMSDPLHADVRTILRSAARSAGVPLGEGSYAAVTGPAFETRAEVRMLALLGADLVGMSTVPEVITAAAAGVRCAALSLVTNRATGLSAEPLGHEEVLETGRQAGQRVAAIVRKAVPRLAGDAGPSASRQSGDAK